MAVEHHRIHVIRALGLGDLLTVVPALRALRRTYPDAVITLFTPAGLWPVVSLIGAINAIVDASDLGAIHLQGPPPHLVVNLHGSGPQSIEAALRLCPRELLTHAHGSIPQMPGPGWKAGMHEVERWCGLLAWGGIPSDRHDLRLATPRDSPLEADAVIIHPGASARARQWPPDRFAAVAAELADRGLTVLVTGSAAERPLAGCVAQAACHARVHCIAGCLSLDALAALVAAARLVVSGDTGVAHLATAYGTPSVVLFGPTPPALWGPPSSGPHRVLWRGGTGDPHAATLDPGLLQISVADVLSAIDTMKAAGLFTVPRPHFDVTEGSGRAGRSVQPTRHCR